MNYPQQPDGKIQSLCHQTENNTFRREEFVVIETAREAIAKGATQGELEG
jgi:hypothetical protein